MGTVTSSTKDKFIHKAANNVAKFVARLEYDDTSDINAVTARAVAKALRDVANAYTVRAQHGARTKIPDSFDVSVDILGGTTALIITEIYKECSVDNQNNGRGL